MSPQTKPTRNLIPEGIDPPALQKGLGCAANLLGRRVPKRGNPPMRPDTCSKMLNTLVVQMVANTNASTAKDILDCFQEVLASFCKEVLALPDPLATLAKAARDLASKRSRPAFGVSPQTLSAHLDRFPTMEADSVLREQLEVIRARMRKWGIWPKEVMLSADPTDAPYRGKFHNQFTSWGKVGSQPTWKRVFKEFGLFATPLQLQVGFAPVPVGAKERKALPAWVRNIAAAVGWFQASFTSVPLVAVDREFYSPLGFAAARLGLLAPEPAAGSQPRLLCPTRFWHSKHDPKWEFLLDKNAAEVRETELELDPRDAARLTGASTRLSMDEKGRYMVPVAVIAGFDTYSGKHEPKSLEWARTEAIRVEQCLHESRAAQQAMNAAYKTMTKNGQGEERALPSNRGRKRQSFPSTSEAELYQACLEARASVARWEGKKAVLHKRLVFFTASLREGEHLAGGEAAFMDLIRQYREHWNLENAYKSQKWQFRLRTNSRTTTARHVRRVLGAMFYNSWHHLRLDRASRVAKKSAPGWKPFDTSSPPVRKKWDREIRPVLTAQGYLLEELSVSMKLSMKIFLTQRA